LLKNKLILNESLTLIVSIKLPDASEI